MYKELSKSILINVGGIENIYHMTHNKKRIKFTLNNNEKVSLINLKKINEIINVFFSEQQLQIIFNENSIEFYNQIIAMKTSTN